MHPHQLSPTSATVADLLRDQFPEWVGLPIIEVESPGTVNALFRVGEQLSARLPLQPADVDATRRWLESEAAATRELLGRTPFATPEPVAIGEPGAGFPLPWSVQTWVPGTTAVEDDPSRSPAFARDLATLIHAVRSIDSRGREFTGSGRGGDLRRHDGWMQACFERSSEIFDVPRLRSLWAELRDLPRTTPDVMTHGDLTPANVLVSHGRLTGVIDVGGLGPADPALDLVAGWHLLEDGPRRVLKEELACDDLEWARGRAWAFEQAMGAAWYYRDSNPAMTRMGRQTIARIVADTS